jgi:hypothetical protein
MVLYIYLQCFVAKFVRCDGRFRSQPFEIPTLLVCLLMLDRKVSNSEFIRRLGQFGVVKLNDAVRRQALS